ncbi:MAG: hypothetical protein JW942_03925 [Opitutales bacterium]|nr:hypothetical protein [Opitutales bacterium]
MKSILLLLSLLLLSHASVYASTLTNDDVIKLAKSGIDESTIILVIQKSEDAKFDTSSDAIVHLSQNGVSGPVLKAMIMAGSDSPQASESPNASPKTQENTNKQEQVDVKKLDPSQILVITDEGEKDLLYTSAQVRTAARALGFGGVASYAVLRGSHAELRINDKTPEFIISVPGRAQVDAFMQLASFAVRKNNSREVLIGGGYMSYSTGIHPDRIMSIRTEKLEDQSRATEGYTLYKVSVNNPLATGEYAIVYYSGELGLPVSAFGGGNAYFDFGIQ